MVWLVIVEWLARLVLLLLVGLSVWSITIIIDRRRYFKQLGLAATSNDTNHWSRQLDKILKEAKSLKALEYSFAAFKSQQKKQMDKGLAVLGTLGPTSPFIGLLGTILGIIVSFAQLSKGGGGTNQVMYSLAEALLLTAVGLLVAIPSVIAFNYFNGQARGQLQEANRQKDLYAAQADLKSE
jgi:biopolymer transport protein ExbB/TolQ